MVLKQIGFVQTSPEFQNKEANFREVEDLAKNVRADLLVLPELFATGYTFAHPEETEALAEKLDGETAEFLRSIAETTSAVVCGGFIQKSEGEEKPYNACLLVNEKEVIGAYQKIHLFNKENLWFTQGNKPFKVYNTANMKIGLMICFDWIFPEAARSLALQGAEILAHPTNLVLPYCQDAMVSRCIENQVFGVTANRIGTESNGEEKCTFTGASQITGTRGEILAKGEIDNTSVVVQEIDTELAHDKSLNPFNHVFNDRRPDLYHLK